MKLNSDEAYKLLMEEKQEKDTRYIEHSICVGNAAERIAKALNLDFDKAKTLGYIHDIGKKYNVKNDGALTHGIKGYNYIKELGYDDEYAFICITHSYLNNDINCLAGFSNPDGIEYEFQKNYVENHKYSIYEKIINLCDLMCTTEFLTLEERLIEIMGRRGATPNTQYHINEATKLKKEIDGLLGYNVYKLFPEIEQRIFQ